MTRHGIKLLTKVVEAAMTYGLSSSYGGSAETDRDAAELTLAEDRLCNYIDQLFEKARR